MRTRCHPPILRASRQRWKNYCRRDCRQPVFCPGRARSDVSERGARPLVNNGNRPVADGNLQKSAAWLRRDDKMRRDSDRWMLIMCRALSAQNVNWNRAKTRNWNCCRLQRRRSLLSPGSIARDPTWPHEYFPNQSLECVLERNINYVYSLSFCEWSSFCVFSVF